MYNNTYHSFRSAIKTSSCVCRWLSLFVVAAVLAVSCGQGTVTVSPDVTVDNGSPTTLSCRYSMDSNYSLYNLDWRRGDSVENSLRIADFVNDVDHPIYYNNFNSSDYTASRDKLNSIASLAIAAVSFQDDSGLFWCNMQVYASGAVTQISASIVVIVTVLPTSITISDETGTYTAGCTSYLIEGEERQYTCLVPDISPGATFTWTVGGRSLTPDGKSNITSSNGLTTSNSTTTITAVAGNDGEMLQCQASNKNGDDGVSTTVVLDVKVPPKASSMLLLGSSGPLGDPADVDEGTSHTFTCRVLGTKPAATIRWFLDNVEQTTTTTTPGAGNGLVDTESHWTFTPERDNHRQVVKCEANTEESQPPFPSVSTTLNVTGPPDTPVISGSLTMTENVATSLNCTADLGYPNNWNLTWSNKDTTLENPLNTTAVPSGTSQRYNFTSQLKFTPQRQNNTHIIKCVASSPSWTSTPLPEETWVPINVQYETNITNKHQTDVGVKSGVTANLSCTAKGNPEPVITWFNPNKTEIINGGNEDKYMVVVSYTTSNADMTIGNVTTSKLTIRAVDDMVDYGVYTCNSNNSIGQPDTHEIILNGTRRPNKPTGVVLVDQTSSSIAVRWSAGYDGGESQWFHVGHKKTADSSETVSDRIDGGVTTYMYNVTGLESYMEYEIKVYAENDLGRNPIPGSVVNYTLPESVTEKGVTIEFNEDEGKVIVTGVQDSGGCIQLEVKYEGSSSDWMECGKCITADSEVVLADWCPQTLKRRRRAAGDVDEVRAKYCEGRGSSALCSDPISAKEVSSVPPPPGSDSTGIIVGGVVGGILLLVVIGILIVYLKRTSPDKPKPTYTDTSSIELATNNFGQNGEVNEGLQSSDESPKKRPAPRPMSTTGKGGAETNARPAVERMVTDTGDTYAIVKKDKSISKPPPQNLPDVTNAVYAAVNKKTPVSGLGKKPKKYVPPSRVNEESEYEDVKLPQQNMKSKIGDAEEDDYANLDQCQTNSGRTVDSDGLIYMEVGHLKTHPANQPPIQTEESTTYASIDFKQLVPPDVARK